MRTTTQKAEYFCEFFTSDARNDGEPFTKLKDDAPQELRDAVRDAHGDRMPSDWVYSTFWDLLQKVTEYNCETIDNLEDYRHEIVDGYVDIYTHDLLNWLASSVDNLEYLENAVAERHFVKEDGAWQLLAHTQYLAIDEIMGAIISLLADGE